MSQTVSAQKSGVPETDSSTRCIGPVPDLEEYVNEDWWCRIFNSLYLKTDGDVIEDTRITSQEVDKCIRTLDLSPEHRILDLCCGQGRHLFELARRGFRNLEGLDRSRYLIKKARASARKENAGIRFREGDARKLPYAADSFDTVMILGNSFGYFETVKEDMKVLQEVLRVLKPWGTLVIDVTDGQYLADNFKSRSWEWIDRKHFVCRERSLSADSQRLVSREVITHTDNGVIADQFYAERLYTKEGLLNLLGTIGFKKTVYHGELVPDSLRKQDLGMMEKRLLITAMAKKEWSSINNSKSKKTMLNIAVLLGDPDRPDPLKPLSRFDDDDFITIDRMKNALRELDGYNFSFICNHTTLIQDLLKLRPGIDCVFNLCDEGFWNDPRKELHVPGLLEMLQIPYTGAGPQCLAFCYDKSLVRGIAKEMEIPVPEAFFVDAADTTFELPFDFPVIVKPNFGDSSFGITQRSVVYNGDELIAAISEIRDTFGYEKPILVEEFLCGKDMSLGIIGNPPESYSVLPIIEEDYSHLPKTLPRICGYEAKWLPESPYSNLRSVPSELPDETQELMTVCSLQLFQRLEVRDYSRFDWRLDSAGNPRLLEVNPNPGWCWDGHLAKMAAIINISYTDMLGAILEASKERLGIAGPDTALSVTQKHEYIQA